MSKELEAFMDILGILSAVTGCDVDTDSEHIKIVKQALQRLEAIDNAKPSEALECFDKLVKQIELDEDTDYLEIRNAHITVEQALLKAEKELNALEIIKEKLVDVFKLYNCKTIEEYNQSQYRDCMLTKEEFSLLKEVLE